VRAALERFRAAGKTILQHELEGTRLLLEFSGKYHCAQPLGEMEIDGMSAQPLFLTGHWRVRHGVQVIQVGKFKAAVEPFLLTKLSPENRQQTEIVGRCLGEWRAAVGKSRKLNPQQLQAIADQSVLMADSLQRGLDG